ncbi:MAG: MFS transporter [Verrucomicrobiota bacterium]
MNLIPSESAPAEPDLKPVLKDKLWHVGTLTYTTVGLVILFAWLLWGDFACAFKDRAVPAIFQLLLKKYGASDMINGLLVGSLPGLIGMVLCPIISCKSDRHRGRWGRRIPFILISTPFAVLSMVGLAFSPTLGADLDRLMGRYSFGLNPSILFSFGLFWMLFEVASFTAGSVIGGLINDVVPQVVIGRFYGMFRALSLLAGMLFNFWMLGKAETYFMWIFLGTAALYGGGFIIMCLKVKEGQYPPPPPAEPGRFGASGAFIAARTYFKECFGHSYFPWYFVTMALSWMAFMPVNLFSVFFAKSIDMSMDTLGKCFALTYLISVGLSYPIGALSDRFHPLRVGLVVQGLYFVLALVGGLWIKGVWSFAVCLLLHGVLVGTWVTATASLSQRLFPREKFGQLSSAAGIVTSLCTIMVGPVMGLFLDYTNHVYRYTYLASSAITLIAALGGAILYRKFLALGGPDNYVPPIL